MLLGLPAGAAAQDVAVPVEVQVPLFLKILTFDRNLLRQRHGELVVGILYQSRYRTSADVADAVRHAVEGSAERPAGVARLRAVELDLDRIPDLEQALRQDSVSVLYVSPLRAVELDRVTTVTRPGRITSLTAVPSYVEDGVAVGLDLQGDRPRIVVNLGAAKAEGADFGAQLLKLARVVGEEGGTQ
jgi:hypothetical protein